MKHGDIQALFQLIFDIKTMWRSNILKINPPKGGRNIDYGFNKRIGVFGIHFNIKYIYASKTLKQYSFPFHHRLAGQRAHITQAKHCRAICNHGNQIAFIGIFIGISWVCIDFSHRLCYAWRIGQRQIILSDAWLSRVHTQLAWLRKLVVIQRAFF